MGAGRRLPLPLLSGQFGRFLVATFRSGPVLSISQHPVRLFFRCTPPSSLVVN